MRFFQLKPQCTGKLVLFLLNIYHKTMPLMSNIGCG